MSKKTQKQLTNPADKFFWEMYSHQLSENVKRGIKAKKEKQGLVFLKK